VKYLLFFVTLVFATGMTVAKELHVALTRIPKVLEFQAKDAPYNRFMSAFTAYSNVQFSQQFMPSSRANKLLREKKIDCIFPIIPPNSRHISTLLSNPINGIDAHIFTLGPRKYSTLKQLEGAHVAYLRGYLFGGIMDSHPLIGFLPVTTQNAALGMLKKKRVDAYIDYLPDIRFVFSKADFELLKYDAQSPVIQESDRMECLSSKEGKALIEELNTFVRFQRSQGTLPQLLGDYFVETN
jgi:ABC-type amino acid transport substrate-binding protein